MARRPHEVSLETSLIKSVEIAYFRSFYKMSLSPLRKINIFFGENDTGKSNVMRALNLFFNGTLGDGHDFDFDIDLSAKRREEANHGADVRKFIYVKVVFRSPKAHRDALGAEFYVKRTWSQMTGSEPGQEISSHIDTPGKQQSLTKFLSKTKFKYIPAVKDRDVYEDLLVDTYNAISKVDEFSKALEAFTGEIRNQTAALSSRLGHSLGMASELSPPTDLADLFGSLDFETLVAGGATMSLLRQRGDGVQARHIPELMAFAAERDTRSFHIWGIEEPENSLSMTSALRAAERLRSLASESNVQIFVTTHSPAFYSLSGADVAKIFLKKEGEDVRALDGSKTSTVGLMEFMGDEFYLPLVAESLKEAEDRAETLAKAAEELRRQVASATRSILFVEGDSESLLIQSLICDAGLNDVVDVVNLRGASHAERLATMAPALVEKLLGNRKGFILLDSDKAGRSALPKNVSRDEARSKWVKAANQLFWRLLSPTDEARAAYKAAGIAGSTTVGVALEDCYTSEVKKRAMDAGVLGLGGPRDFVHSGADLFAVSPALASSEHQFYLRQVRPETKMTFARWLLRNELAGCAPLLGILADLKALIVGNDVDMTGVSTR